MFRVLRYLSVAALLLMASCTQGRVEYPAEFALADSLAEHNEAQRALALLDSVSGDVALWTEPVRMRYALLRYKAQDKSYVPITSDSTILPILRYYEQTREEWLPEAYYYAGRTYTDLGDAPRALDYFQQAATLMEKTHRWDRVLSRTYAQMADLFSKRWMTNESIKYYKKSAVLSEQERDSSSLVSTYSNIASNYREEDWDSVVFYSDKATAIAEAFGDTIWCYQLYRIKAGTLLSLGNPDEAKEALKKCFIRNDWPGFAGCWSVAACLYEALGKIDSMEYCLHKAFEEGNIYGQRTSAAQLAKLYSNKNKTDSAQFYLSKCLMLSDSIELINNVRILQEMESSYNYNYYVRENEVLRNKEQSDKFQRMLLLAITLFISLLGMGSVFFIFKRYKWLKYKNAAQLSLLHSLTSERIPSLEQELQKKEELYSNVSFRNDYLQTQIDLLRSELDTVRQQQKTQVSQLELERSKIKGTDLYRSLVPSSKIKDSQIKAIREYYQKNNPKFLKSLTTLCDLSAEELTVSLLIRMGYNQRQISDFMCRVPGTIQNMRQKIILRVKGPGSKAEEWNRIIESL